MSAWSTQFFLNMEIERYTLATGETALTGFSRFWRHWGLVFAILDLLRQPVAGLGDQLGHADHLHVRRQAATWIAIGILLVDRAGPDVGPGRLRRAGAGPDAQGRRRCCCCSWSAPIFAIGADAWADLPQVVTRPRIPADELGFAVLLGALAFAGAGGGQNLVPVQLDPGQGLRHGQLRAPAGQPDHRRSRRPRRSTGYIFEPTEENMERWRGWWRFANIEQLSTFVLITFVTILFTSLLAYSTVFGREDLPNNIAFIQTEGEVLGERVGSWFQYFFWTIGAFSLFAAAMGIVDYTSRLAADVLKTSYAHNANESSSTPAWSGASC